MQIAPSLRLRFAVTLAGFFVVLISCRDRSSPTVPLRTSARTSVSLDRVTDPSAWDTFAADVAITLTRQGGKDNPPAIPPVAYHLERSRRANGLWRNVMTIDRSAMWLALGTSGQRRPARAEVGRIVDDGDGTPPRMYDGNGAEIRRGALGALPKSFRPDPTFASALASARSDARPVDVPRTSQAWLEKMILVPQRVGARRDAFARAYGRSRVSSIGVDEYQTVSDSTTRIIRVAASTQALMEIEHRAAGVLRWRWQFGYETQADGTMIRTAITSERFDPVTGERRSTVTRFSNIHLEQGR